MIYHLNRNKLQKVRLKVGASVYCKRKEFNYMKNEFSYDLKGIIKVLGKEKCKSCTNIITFVVEGGWLNGSNLH